ncbi:MAG: efflux RND transporter periplasmic adaptor subunit [Gemmatimonas sp.]
MRRHYLVAAAMVASLACSKKKADEGDSAVRPVVNVQTVVVRPQSFNETLGAMGTVAPRAGHVATLSAPAASRVAQVFVTTGQRVERGKVLVELDQAPFQSALQSAEAALAAAERANERAQRLAQEGIVPRKDAEQAAADVAKARADAVAARRTEQLSILRAPIAGIVTRMSATLGASVDPAQPLIEISDPSALDVLLSVTPTDAARVRPGAKVSLSAGQTASGEPLGVGSVVDISGTVDSASRSVAVRVQAPTTRRPLRIGETVFGAISVGVRPAAMVVPADALVPEGDEFKVFVVDGSGVAHERDVKIGGRSSAGVEILEGLQAGERVVTYGAFGVQDSAKVVQLAPASGPPATPATKPEKP